MGVYDNKKYYWLKLTRGFFKRHDIQVIEAMPNGKDYVLFYLKLMVESIDHDGYLRFSATIPYNEEMLATITNTNIDIVRSAVKILSELDMLEVLDDQTIYMTEVQSMIGSQTEGAKKKQEQRLNSEKRMKQLMENTPKTAEADICPPTVHLVSEKCLGEKEKEIDIYNTHYRAHAPERTREEVITIEQVITTKDGESYTLGQVLELVEQKAPMCYRRHLSAMNGDERLLEVLRQNGYPLAEITALFEKAAKTFVKKSSYTNCDIIWVFDNKERIESEEDVKTTGFVREEKPQMLRHNYSAEDWAQVYTPIEQLDL